MDDIQQLTLADLRALPREQRENAFEVLVNAATPSLLKRAKALLNDEQLAEDVCQEAWLILYRAMRPSLLPFLSNGNVPESPIVPWLHGVVRNLSLKKLKRRSHVQYVALVDDPGPPGKLHHGVAPETDFREGLEAALAQLSEAEREVFVLRCFEGRSFEEIAARAAVGESAARQRLCRAREKLRRQLEDRS